MACNIFWTKQNPQAVGDQLDVMIVINKQQQPKPVMLNDVV